MAALVPTPRGLEGRERGASHADRFGRGLSVGISGAVGPLRGFARSLCPGDTSCADDLAQDALARVGRHRASFRQGTDQKAWLFAILRDRFLSEAGA
jgi:hypothetical protein